MWKHEEKWPIFHLFSVNMNIGHISVSFSYDGNNLYHFVQCMHECMVPGFKAHDLHA